MTTIRALAVCVMRTKLFLILAGGILVAVIAARDGQSPPKKANRETEEAAAEDDTGPEAAREVIRQSANDFEKGNAKDVAAFWAENGEYLDDGSGVHSKPVGVPDYGLDTETMRGGFTGAATP